MKDDESITLNKQEASQNIVELREELLGEYKEDQDAKNVL